MNTTSILSSVAQVFNGKTPSREEQRQSGYPVLKIKDVTEYGEFTGFFDSFVDADFAAKYSSKHIQAGDILVLNAAHNADYVASKVYLAEASVTGALPTGEWLIIRPDQGKVIPSFIYHWLTNPRTAQSLRALVRGIHLYPRDVQRLEICVPPIEEQVRVSKILENTSSLTRKRRLSQQLIAKLPLAIFDEMFGSQGRHNCSARSLGDLVSLVSGGTPTKSKQEYWNGKVLWVSPKDMKPREIWDSQDHISEDAVKEAGLKLIPKDTVLIVVRGMILAHTVPIRLARADVTINQDMKALLPKTNLNPRYLRWALQSIHSEILAAIGTASHGTRRLESETFLQFCIPVPSDEAQQEFANAIQRLEQVQNNMDRSAERIQTLSRAARKELFEAIDTAHEVVSKAAIHV